MHPFQRGCNLDVCCKFNCYCYIAGILISFGTLDVDVSRCTMQCSFLYTVDGSLFRRLVD